MFSFLCNCMQESFLLLCAYVKEAHKCLQFAGAKSASLRIAWGTMSRGNTKWVSLSVYFCNPVQAANMFCGGGGGGTIWAAKSEPFLTDPQINSSRERPVTWLPLAQGSRCGGGFSCAPACSSPTEVPWRRRFKWIWGEGGTWRGDVFLGAASRLSCWLPSECSQQQGGVKFLVTWCSRNRAAYGTVRKEFLQDPVTR